MHLTFKDLALGSRIFEICVDREIPIFGSVLAARLIRLDVGYLALGALSQRVRY